MARRNKKYAPKPYQSPGIKGDCFVMIYMGMLCSTAWKDLTPQQQILYLYCAIQSHAERPHPMNNDSYFTMNQSKWSGLYGLYKKSNAKGFQRDMTALISHGFIKCMECGSLTRTKSIYALSDKYIEFGQPAFRILPSEMTSAMLRKAKAKHPENQEPMA